MTIDHETELFTEKVRMTLLSFYNVKIYHFVLVRRLREVSYNSGKYGLNINGSFEVFPNFRLNESIKSCLSETLRIT